MLRPPCSHDLQRRLRAWADVDFPPTHAVPISRRRGIDGIGPVLDALCKRMRDTAEETDICRRNRGGVHRKFLSHMVGMKAV